MKEKIKVIVLIVIFIIVLIVANNLLNNSEPIQNNSDNNTIENSVNIEPNITTSVISKYNQNETGTFYTEIEDDVENTIADESIKENKSSGYVVEVTQDNFEAEVLSANEKVLIDFYADWCVPCKTLSPIVEEVAEENPNLKVVKINVDENEKLAYEYGAYSIPTLVVIENGKVIDGAVGAISKEAVLELVK